MSATIIDMRTYLRERDPADIACDQVKRQLHYRVTSTILSQALARCGRLIAQGQPINVAAAHAVSWALYADQPQPPEAA